MRGDKEQQQYQQFRDIIILPITYGIDAISSVDGFFSQFDNYNDTSPHTLATQYYHTSDNFICICCCLPPIILPSSTIISGKNIRQDIHVVKIDPGFVIKNSPRGYCCIFKIHLLFHIVCAQPTTKATNLIIHPCDKILLARETIVMFEAI